MRILIAFDKFKDALTAPQACAAAADALRRRFPQSEIDECPLADGGEGFGSILTAAAGGKWINASVTGPRGGPVSAGFGLVEINRVPAAALARLNGDERWSAIHSPSGHPGRDGTDRGLAGMPPERGNILGVVEMAEATGLQLVAREERDPWQATSIGTGELIRRAVGAGASAILVGAGGSATHDLGLGALAALGLILADAAGQQVTPPYPRDWPRIVRVSGEIALPPLYLACDVSNPLLGARGAAAVYGPQKGLRSADFESLENETRRLALLLCAWAGVAESALNEAGAGAAGGIGFGMRTAAAAQLVAGADLIADWLDLHRRVAAADLVITGEGRFDLSSAEGKGPGALAKLAAAQGKPVHIFAGQVDLPAAACPPRWRTHAITPAGTPLAAALAAAEMNLRRALTAASLQG